MNETMKNRNDYVCYEYKSILVSREMKPMYADNYPQFGWLLEKPESNIGSLLFTTMKFKRDRNISNKMELNKLQCQFDDFVAEIENLEHSKYQKPVIIALSIGILGIAFMAGSVFACLAGMFLLMAALAVPGFAGWIIPYFCFKYLRRQKERETAPLIDQKLDGIYEVCKKANCLLDKDSTLETTQPHEKR